MELSFTGLFDGKAFVMGTGGLQLTPDEVENKRFKIIRFKEGCDEDDVDSFLDEVVAVMRQLIDRIAELEARMSDA